MRVACVEAVGDAPALLAEHDVLTPDRPVAGQRPVVDGQALGELVDAPLVERGAARGREALAARVAEIGLGGLQVVPVGLRFHPDPFDGDQVALDAEQLLDDAL